MIRIDVPGRDIIEIEHVVLDYNGTIAFDGQLIEGAAWRIRELCKSAHVYVLTADTYGTVRSQCDGLCAEVKTFPRANAAECKEEIVRALGGKVACVGNGFNDIKMFDIAELAIAVMDGEGVCAALLSHAAVLVRSAEDGLALLLKPDRRRATLRT